MSRRATRRWFSWLLLGLSLLAPAAQADDLLMVRAPDPFPETMLALQQAIEAHGYQVSRVQRVDVGLTRSGFKTDKYRIVFFARPDEVRELLHRYPQIAPYLPLKITLFAEQDETLLTTFDPTMLMRLAPQDKDLAARLRRWKGDLLSIFREMREGEGGMP